MNYSLTYKYFDLINMSNSQDFNIESYFSINKKSPTQIFLNAFVNYYLILYKQKEEKRVIISEDEKKTLDNYKKIIWDYVSNKFSNRISSSSITKFTFFKNMNEFFEMDNLEKFSKKLDLIRTIGQMFIEYIIHFGNTKKIIKTNSDCKQYLVTIWLEDVLVMSMLVYKESRDDPEQFHISISKHIDGILLSFIEPNTIDIQKNLALKLHSFALDIFNGQHIYCPPLSSMKDILVKSNIPYNIIYKNTEEHHKISNRKCFDRPYGVDYYIFPSLETNIKKINDFKNLWRL